MGRNLFLDTRDDKGVIKYSTGKVRQGSIETTIIGPTSVPESTQTLLYSRRLLSRKRGSIRIKSNNEK